jgi:hypothetical protein
MLLWVSASRLPKRIEATAMTLREMFSSWLSRAAGAIWNSRSSTANTATLLAVARNAETGAGAPS